MSGRHTATRASRSGWRRVVAAAAAALSLAACASARGLFALRQVDFSVDRVASVRLAGVALDRVRSAADLGLLDAGRIAAAVARRQVPLEFDLHLLGRNPAENRTTARMTRLRWTLDLNGRETVSGTLDTTYSFPPGGETDVRVPIQLDLAQLLQGGASDALNLALGLAGLGSRPTEIAVRAVPTIETPLGAIQYPGTITIVRRNVGGR